VRQKLGGDVIGGLGFVVWMITVAIVGSQLGVITSLLLVGPLIVVPLGLRFLQPDAAWLSLLGLAVVPAVIIRSGSDERRLAAVVLAAVWLVASFGIALPPAYQWFVRPQGKRLTLNNVLPLAAYAELVIAAAWLVAATLQIELLGFSRTIVLLTAVHFHMAGFGACTVALLRMRNAATETERRWAGRGAMLVLGASPVVAIGHLTIGALELLGGILLTAGVWIVAYLGWREAKHATSIVRVLLIVGALSPVIPMLFAIHYGLTRVSDLQQIRFSTIALIHGGLNAFGFLTTNLVAQSLTVHLQSPRSS
jgi:hypothetical protein